ncbi:hypothetical protein CR165_22565 [Pseudoroseomonas aestuarii]|uniref:Insertion element IS402-like domain-containing protein n=1 Tax=Teichococcus aestuarii TaxID=568898 RepID=A0A2U1UY09_9PROT|nr:hypothetical protein CR165_22565 [Pseudoroseomonas aestuarii]
MVESNGNQVFTDATWAICEPLIGEAKPHGKTPPKDLRRTISAILWRHQNGAKWRSIPDDRLTHDKVEPQQVGAHVLGERLSVQVAGVVERHAEKLEQKKAEQHEGLQWVDAHQPGKGELLEALPAHTLDELPPISMAGHKAAQQEEEAGPEIALLEELGVDR